MSDRQNAIRLLAADAHARGLSCFSNSLKIIADGYGKLEAELAALKEENERLKAEKNSIGAKLVGSRLAVGQLKARVAELAGHKKLLLGQLQNCVNLLHSQKRGHWVKDLDTHISIANKAIYSVSQGASQ